MGANSEFYGDSRDIGSPDFRMATRLRAMEESGDQPTLWGLGQQAVEPEVRLVDDIPSDETESVSGPDATTI